MAIGDVVKLSDYCATCNRLIAGPAYRVPGGRLECMEHSLPADRQEPPLSQHCDRCGHAVTAESLWERDGRYQCMNHERPPGGGWLLVQTRRQRIREAALVFDKPELFDAPEWIG
jgi:hypothetical protein